MNRIQKFFRSYSDELINKVTWPSVEELQSYTVTVLIASLILALVVALMDLIFNYGMQFIYGLFQ